MTVPRHRRISTATARTRKRVATHSEERWECLGLDPKATKTVLPLGLMLLVGGPLLSFSICSCGCGGCWWWCWLQYDNVNRKRLVRGNRMSFKIEGFVLPRLAGLTQSYHETTGVRRSSTNTSHIRYYRARTHARRYRSKLQCTFHSPSSNEEFGNTGTTRYENDTD